MGIRNVTDVKGLGESVVFNPDGFPIELFSRYARLVQSVRHGNIAVSKSPDAPLEEAVWLYETMKPIGQVEDLFYRIN